MKKNSNFDKLFKTFDTVKSNEIFAEVLKKMKEIPTSFKNKFEEIARKDGSVYKGVLIIHPVNLNTGELGFKLSDIDFKITCDILPLSQTLAYRTYVKVKDETTIPTTYYYKQIPELGFKVINIIVDTVEIKFEAYSLFEKNFYEKTVAIDLSLFPGIYLEKLNTLGNKITEIILK